MDLRKIPIEEAKEIAEEKKLKPGLIKNTDRIIFTDGENDDVMIVSWADFERKLEDRRLAIYEYNGKIKVLGNDDPTYVESLAKNVLSVEPVFDEEGICPNCGTVILFVTEECPECGERPGSSEEIKNFEEEEQKKSEKKGEAVSSNKLKTNIRERLREIRRSFLFILSLHILFFIILAAINTQIALTLFVIYSLLSLFFFLYVSPKFGGILSYNLQDLKFPSFFHVLLPIPIYGYKKEKLLTEFLDHPSHTSPININEAYNLFLFKTSSIDEIDDYQTRENLLENFEEKIKSLIKSEHLRGNLKSLGKTKYVPPSYKLNNLRKQADQLASQEINSLIQSLNFKLEKCERLLHKGKFDEFERELDRVEGELEELEGVKNIVEKFKNLKKKLRKVETSIASKEVIKEVNTYTKIKKCEELIDEKEFEKCENKIRNVAKDIIQIKDNLSPEIEVEFVPQQKIELETWTEIALKITNTGEMHAKNIDIDIEDELKVHGDTHVNQIEGESSKKVELRILASGRGKVPIQVTTEYEGILEGEKYKKTHESDLVVGGESR